MPLPLTIFPIEGVSEIVEGDDIAAILCGRLNTAGMSLTPGDILVIAQKVVSKSEGRMVDLGTVVASPEAMELAGITGKEAKLIEVVLRESSTVMRAKTNVLVVRHKLGLVMANAGIDRSNVPSQEGDDIVLLLPENPDQSAEHIRNGIRALSGVDIGVIISDSFGRAWRNGVVNVAIGAAGVASLVDRRGEHDRQNRRLMVTEVAHADAIAGAAGIVMGEGAEGIPAALVRGSPYFTPHGNAAHLIRPLAQDMFP